MREWPSPASTRTLMGMLGLDGHSGVPPWEAQPTKLWAFILKLCVSGCISFLGPPQQSPTNRTEAMGMSSPLLLEARGPWSTGSKVAPENPERGPMPAALPAGLCQHPGQPWAFAGRPLVSVFIFSCSFPCLLLCLCPHLLL